MPLAAALSLVLLACWGVRARDEGTRPSRRGRAGSRHCPGSAGHHRRRCLHAARLLPRPAASRPSAPCEVESSFTAWYAAALVAAVAAASSPRWPRCATCPTWPEMGSRYDAPAGGADGAGRARGQPRALEGPRRGSRPDSLPAPPRLSRDPVGTTREHFTWRTTTATPRQPGLRSRSPARLPRRRHRADALADQHDPVLGRRSPSASSPSRSS